MILSFIGMSGSGKSYWSKKLETKGFTRFCCDDFIEQKLGDEFKKLGNSGIQDVAKWMGQPFEPQYKKSSKRYLQLEKESLEEILEYIENTLMDKHIVIDTTGSVIHMKNDLLKKLAVLTTVIYFETPDIVKEEMYQLYLKDPKPVIWGTIFKQTENETVMEALAKCYPKLLSYRSKKYGELAHRKFDYHTLRSLEFNVDLFLQISQ